MEIHAHMHTLVHLKQFRDKDITHYAIRTFAAAYWLYLLVCDNYSHKICTLTSRVSTGNEFPPPLLPPPLPACPHPPFPLPPTLGLYTRVPRCSNK